MRSEDPDPRLTSKLKHSEQEISRLSDTINSLKSQNNNLSNELDRIKSDFDKVCQVIGVNKDCDVLEQNNSQLENQVFALKREMGESSDQKRIFKDLESKLSERDSRITNLEKELELKKKECGEYQSDIQTLKSQLKSTQAEHDQSSRDYGILQQDLEDFKRENARFKKSLMN